MIESFTVQVPGSTANLGSGFDTVSAALSLRLSLQVQSSEGGVVEWVQGSDPTSILPGGDNLVQKALDDALKFLGAECCGLRINMHNPIPLKRGLGSSAAAIVAGIKIAERISGVNLDVQQVFDLALSLEGHPDNLAASLLGGWVLSRVSNGRMQAERLYSPLDCRFVLCVPETLIATPEARSILPRKYPLEDVTFNLQRCALLVHALHAGRAELLREATSDRLHQPFRSRLVPGLQEMLNLEKLSPDLAASLLAISISGSGSAVVALVDSHSKDIGHWMVETLASHGTASNHQVLDLDTAGAKVETLGDPKEG